MVSKPDPDEVVVLVATPAAVKLRSTVTLVVEAAVVASPLPAAIVMVEPSDND